MTAPSKTLVLETRFAGHTIGFAWEMALAFANNRYDTHLVLNGYTKDRPELSTSDQEKSTVQVHWTEPFKPEFASADQGLAELELLSDLVRTHRPGRVIVPTGDAIAAALIHSEKARVLEATLPRLDIVLHHVAAAYLPTGLSTWRRWQNGLAELRALKRHRLLTCDAFIGLGPGQWGGWPSGARFEYLPHILGKHSPFDRAAARAHFNLPDDKKVLVSIGDVAHRKGIDKLIAAATGTAWPEEVQLLLAGPVSSKLRDTLNKAIADRPGRIQLIDRFLTDDEFAAAFVAADMIWAVTPTNLGVSSTFLYAARHAKTAIVASGHRSATWMAGRIGAGIPTSLDPPAICRAVERAYKAPAQTAEQASFLKRIIDMETYTHVTVAR